MPVLRNHYVDDADQQLISLFIFCETRAFTTAVQLIEAPESMYRLLKDHR